LVPLRCFLVLLGVLLVKKTLEDEQYVFIKAYKLTVFEILINFFCIAIYCVSALSLHIESTDSMITKVSITKIASTGALRPSSPILIALKWAPTFLEPRIIVILDLDDVLQAA